jgi:hypothetical protein
MMTLRERVYQFTITSLARHAAIPNYLSIPKAVLYKRLKDSYNLDRLQRAEARRRQISSNRKDNFALRRAGVLENWQERSNSSSSSCCASSSSSSSSANNDDPFEKALKDKLQQFSKRSLKKPEKEKIVELDPVMLSELDEKYVWKHTRNNGKC